MTAKKIFVTILILAIAASSTIGVPVKAQTPVDSGRGLVFLKDVAGVDVDRYEVTLISSQVYGFVNWDLATETYSHLKVRISFVNETLRDFSLYVEAGVAYYSKPLPSNVLEAAKMFLERYQNFSGDAELTTMRNMLTTVDVTKNSTKLEGNLKLEVSAVSNRTYLEWIQSQNGVDFNSFTLGFENGVFNEFHDSRSYRMVGSAEVNISKEQAINMALKEADGLSYTYNGKLVDNLTIVESAIQAELKANLKYIDKPTLFYPCWSVILPLNDVYPGFIYYIQVKLWADSGEIISVKTMGYGGAPNQDDNIVPSESPSSSPTATMPAESTNTNQKENDSPTSTAIIATIIMAVILIPVLAAALIIKKRKKT